MLKRLENIHSVALVAFLLLIATPTHANELRASLRIGAAFALSGVASSFGKSELNGATLAIEEFNSAGGLNGQSVELTVEDTASTSIQTVGAVSKLINLDKQRVILGTTWLDSFKGVLPIADRKKVLLVTPSACIPVMKKSENEFPLVFSTWHNLEKTVVTLLRHIAATGAKRIVTAYDNDPYYQAVSELTRTTAEKLGLEVVKAYNLSMGDANFRSVLVKIKELEPDGIVFGFNGEAANLNFYRQRKEIFPELKIFTYHEVGTFLGTDAFQGLITNVDYVVPEAADKAFAEKYRKRFHEEPILSASNSYDAAHILLQALQHGHQEPAAIAAYLSANSFDTVTFGEAAFNAEGGIEAGSFSIRKIP